MQKYANAAKILGFPFVSCDGEVNDGKLTLNFYKTKPLLQMSCEPDECPSQKNKCYENEGYCCQKKL